MVSLGPEVDLNWNCVKIPSLLKITTTNIVNEFDKHVEEVEILPVNLKERIFKLLTKRGSISDDNIDKIVYKGLKVLDFSECDISDRGLYKFDRNVCLFLKKIDLNAAKDNRTTITSAGLIHISSCCPSLEVLYLRRCINVTDDGITAIAQNCRRLVDLNIGGCPQLTDRSLEAVADNCARLRSLNISKANVTDNGVFRLASGLCKESLTEIHINGCRKLTDESVEAIVMYCPNVKIFIFHSCPLITEQARVALDELRMSSNVKQLTWTVY